MKSNNLKKTALSAIILLLVIAAFGGAVTYAWFTYNSSVWTNRIEAKTSSPEVKLLLGLKKEPFDSFFSHKRKTFKRYAFTHYICITFAADFH